MKKVSIVLFSFFLVIVLTISSLAYTSPFNLVYISSPDYNVFNDFILIDDLINSDPFYLYPGVKYLLSVTLDSSYIVSNSVRYYCYNSNQDVLVLVTPQGCLLDSQPVQQLSYFDPQSGGSTRNYILTVNERCILNNVSDASGVTVSISYYNGQTGVIDSGNSVMALITSFLNEIVLHWNLLLFVVVIPVIAISVTLIISFRERRDKN